MSKKIFVAGAGGFIGGHIVKELMKRGYEVKAADIKPFNEWFQMFDGAMNYERDLSDKNSCYEMVDGCDEVINMACNMGGMGFIENNKALCMLSVLVNTHLLMACREFKVKKYFFSSSACAYNKDLQNETGITGLKEEDAYPANPEDGYGWEKLFSERMCRHFYEDYKLDVKVARYHNIYGPNGTYDGGREKAPAALCRKIINSILNNDNEIDVWGDGEQTRSFLYIEDCVEATLNFFDSEFHGPINIGSEEKVSINQMIDKIEVISNKRVNRNYQLDKPKGVRGRNSDNTLIRKQLGWNPKYDLHKGLEKTYQWIFSEIKKKHNQ
jgi:GDP-D-mannose 3',5'-epimerase